MTSHCCDEIRNLDSQTRTHRATAREPCHVHAVWIGRKLLDDVSPDLPDELHVIGGPGSVRRIASRPLIRIDLGRKTVVVPACRETLCLQHKMFNRRWKDGDEILPRRLFAPPRRAQEVSARAARSVEHEYGRRIGGHTGERHPHDVMARVAVNGNQPAIDAWSVRDAAYSYAVAGNAERGHGLSGMSRRHVPGHGGPRKHQSGETLEGFHDILLKLQLNLGR